MEMESPIWDQNFELQASIILMTVMIMVWIGAEINLAPEKSRRSRREKRKKISTPPHFARGSRSSLRDLDLLNSSLDLDFPKYNPSDNIQVDVSRIGGIQTSFPISYSDRTENPINMIARENPKRAADLIEKAINAGLSAKMDEESKRTIIKLFKTQPGLSKVRIVVLKEKGLFGLPKKRDIYIAELTRKGQIRFKHKP